MQHLTVQVKKTKNQYQHLVAHEQQGKEVAAQVRMGFESLGNLPNPIKSIDTVQRDRKKRIICGKHSQIAILKIDLNSNQSTDEKLNERQNMKANM